MKILSIDTSTEACSAALYIDDEVRERFEIAPSKHSQLILPMANSLLNEAHIVVSDLDAIGFSCGPGSFTGLRIASGVIQGIALGADIPVVRISTLAALAQYAFKEKKERNILTALDARMNEVYWGMFQFDSMGELHKISEEIVCLPAQISKPDKGLMEELTADRWFGVGPGWTRYSSELLATLSTKPLFTNGVAVSFEINVFPQARYVAELTVKEFMQGNVVAPEHAVPVYLRDNVAKKSKKNER